MSFAAYKRIMEETENPRQIERRILSRINGMLEQHQIYFDAASPGERLALLAGELMDILWENERLWQALMTDLAQPENTLPAALKAGLLSIGGWVERYTATILGGKGDLAPLIEVNRNVEKGLAGKLQASPQPAQPVALAAVHGG